jgi:hypothetical protein
VPVITKTREQVLLPLLQYAPAYMAVPNACLAESPDQIGRINHLAQVLSMQEVIKLIKIFDVRP